MVVGRHASQERVPAHGLRPRFRQASHDQAVVVRAGGLEHELSQDGPVQVRKLEQRDVGRDREEGLQKRQEERHDEHRTKARDDPPRRTAQEHVPPRAVDEPHRADRDRIGERHDQHRKVEIAPAPHARGGRDRSQAVHHGHQERGDQGRHKGHFLPEENGHAERKHGHGDEHLVPADLVHHDPADPHHGRGQDREQEEHRRVAVHRGVVELQVAEESGEQERDQRQAPQEPRNLAPPVEDSLYPRAPRSERFELQDVVAGRDLVASDDLLVLAHEAVVLVHALPGLSAERLGGRSLVAEVGLDHRRG